MFGYKARLTEDSVVMVETPSKLVADRAKTCGSDPAQMQRALIQLSEWLDRGVTEGRAALDSLRVASRETNDLAVAFDRAILECQQGRELNTQLSVNGIMTALHPVLQDEIFCIGHEAIRNACLHSKGKRLSMESRYRRDLVLEVADDGISIKQTLLHGRAVTLDLVGLRERAERIGAVLNIRNSKAGTLVQLVMPRNVAFRTMPQICAVSP